MPLPKPAAALVAFALLAAACQQREVQPENAAVEADSGKGIQRERAGQPLPDVELSDADKEPASLADEKGGPLLVNIWATWCAPCVKELPTLEAVAAREGALRVVAVSQDMAPRGSVDAFLDQHKLGNLEVWHDPKMALSSAAGVEVLPTTILYDAQGREVWRYVGDLDWTGEEAARLLAEAGARRP
jgi:thiol-disulfide isomerase/thioredoxin